MRVVVADPDLQQARHAWGMLLRGSEELKKQVLPSIAAGEAIGVLRAVGARGRQRRRGDAHPRQADGDDWVLNGSKCWITNGGNPPGTR